MTFPLNFNSENSITKSRQTFSCARKENPLSLQPHKSAGAWADSIELIVFNFQGAPSWSCKNDNSAAEGTCCASCLAEKLLEQHCCTN